MDFVKEYIFTTKPRPTLMTATVQPSISSSSTATSDPFDLSSLISNNSMEAADEEQYGGGGQEDQLQMTGHDDDGGVGGSIGNQANGHDDDNMTNTPPSGVAAAAAANPPAIAPFPLRHNNKNKTPASARNSLATAASTHKTATSVLEKQQPFNHDAGTTSGSSSAASLPYHRSPQHSLYPDKHSIKVNGVTPYPLSYNNPHGGAYINGENKHDDHENDDILGRLMSHPVTAQWMLATANQHHHHETDNTTHTNAAGADAGTNAAGWPMICVVGDTSSGKSSLLCNLSGIELPSHHQLTTRCPILLHIARRQRPPPQQQQQQQDNIGRAMITKTATIQIVWQTPSLTGQQPQPSWPERTCTDPNWQDIPTSILEAQEFILQQTRKQVAPDIVRVDVVYYCDTENNEKEEKKDEIHPQIVQYDKYPYLTLLDLPGLIQTSAADESPTLVSEVQALVRAYLYAPQMLILAVLSCTTDFHNAQVLAEILRVDNNDLVGRTIPVLTKPDLMDPGAAEIALRDDLLLGGKQLIPKTISTTTSALNMGSIQSSWSDDLASPSGNLSGSSIKNPFTFHMVKGRGQAALDRGDSVEQGLKDEAQFFEAREPWKTVQDRSLFGTRHLQAKLARLQHDIVRKNTLPRLHVHVQERRHALHMELQDLIGGSGTSSCNNNGSMEMGAKSASMLMAVMLETPADRRRYYQQVSQTLVASLQASLSGKKQHLATTTTTTSSRATGTRSTRLAYRKQLQQFNHCMGTTCSSARQDDTITNATSSRGTMITASAQLHEACNHFNQSVRQGSLATIKSVVEGAQVIVTAPSASNNGSRSSSSGGAAVRQVRGEVVHLDESFACVDYIDPADAQSDILFYSTRSTMFNNVAVEDVIEEDDVWSDGNHVYIARRGGVYDTLQKIPLDRLRTDPSWLKEKIEQNRTDDLGCFLNAEIFQSIVSDFIDEDWRPSCLALLDRMREILRVTVQRVVHETTGGTGRSKSRYPGLQKWLVQQCRIVAEDLIQQAYEQVESHLMMEKQHPYTQDHNLFQNMAQARHANLKRELEVALRLDHQEPQPQQHSSSQVKLSNGKSTSSVMNTSRLAIQGILDEVFERHSKKSVEDHMAEEMEIVLEAYGIIATRRVMDRTPMICWQVYRSITAAIQDALYCSVTDEVLENQILRQAPDFEKQYNQLIHELKEWNQALEIVESVMEQASKGI